MSKWSIGRAEYLGLALAILLLPSALWAAAAGSRPSVYQATLDEHDQKTPEISTEQLQQILSKKSGIVVDARPRDQYAIAHIPGSISLEEKGFIRFIQSYPDRETNIVLYSNGPHCDLAKRRAAELLTQGYTKVNRYQLGIAVWRALGNTAETSVDGFRRLFANENNAVFVDARKREEYIAGTIPGAESIRPGEGAQAAKDRRLAFFDYNARIIVFAYNVQDARLVAEELARNSYSNSSYVAGSFDDLRRAKFFVPRRPSPSYLDKLPRTP